jgi:hypothetical protein
MKITNLLLGFLLIQAAVPCVDAKPLALYRVEGSSTKAENKLRKLTKSREAGKSAAMNTFDSVEDFSDEAYDELQVPQARTLYQSEEELMLKERREMFLRNLGSMSLSFAVIVPSTSEDPTVDAAGDQEDVYATVRMKLLGEGSDETFDRDVDASINMANELASENKGTASGTVRVDKIENVTEYASSGEDTDAGYGTLRKKLLGIGGDDKYQETIDEDIREANRLATEKEKGMAHGMSTRNLLRR